VQASNSLLAARVGWRNERYSVSLWGDNLTDETVMTAVGPQTIFGGIDGGLQVYLNESRTYGLTMDVRF
jgi:outer membrane receptor protein involved in Fe transport